MKHTQPREKSKVVCIEMRVSALNASIYVQRRWPGEVLRWRPHLRITPASLRRLARVAVMENNDDKA